LPSPDMPTIWKATKKLRANNNFSNNTNKKQSKMKRHYGWIHLRLFYFILFYAY